MLHAFTTYVQEAGLLRKGGNYIVACSGGVDSVVLAHLCYKAGYTFSIAHCNFNLRGDESKRDEAFVQALAQQYNVPFYVVQFQTEAYGEMKKLSVQEAARELRYNWYEKLRKEKGATYTLLAHHANDNIETVVMHFFRGTGLHGLTGMEMVAPHSRCLRPLLPFTRTQIMDYARAEGLSWVEDSSNSSNKYTRNFFRNSLLPAVQKIYPQAEENILSNIERLTKVEKLYTPLVEKLCNRLLQKNGDGYKVALNHLAQYTDTSLPYELFKKFGFTEGGVAEIMKLSGSESGRYVHNDNYRVLKNRAWLLIMPHANPLSEPILIEKGTKKASLPIGVIEIKTIPVAAFTLNTSKVVAQVAAKEIQFPLLLRRWKEGDYFYPLGMPKKKKLARFFIDQKMAASDKENIWVVESNKRIVWVIGHRIDDRFKVAPHTEEILQLSLH